MIAKVEKKTAKEIRRKEFGYRSPWKKTKKKQSMSYSLTQEADRVSSPPAETEMMYAIVIGVNVRSTSTSSWRRNHPSFSFVVMWQLIQTLKNAASRTR
jgi:hypothetical protein